MILRYVADAPLSSIRSDLGLAPLAAFGRSSYEEVREFKRALDGALQRLSSCEATAARLTDLVVNPPGSQLVQNTRSSVVHIVLPRGGERASCGWHVGASKVKLAHVKGLPSLAGIPWFMPCERCLFSESAAAQAAQGDRVMHDPLSDSE